MIPKLLAVEALKNFWTLFRVLKGLNASEVHLVQEYAITKQFLFLFIRLEYKAEHGSWYLLFAAMYPFNGLEWKLLSLQHFNHFLLCDRRINVFYDHLVGDLLALWYPSFY